MKKILRVLRLQLIVILLVLFAVPGITNAALLCRSDPVVILSNGVTMDIGATISVLPWQVKEVHYELHVPVGVKLVLSIGTPTWLTTQETFTVIDDQPRDQYLVHTTVYTTDGNADVSADTILVSALRLKLGSYSAQGKEGQRLTVAFTGGRSGR